jgi:hypothetical protein
MITTTKIIIKDQEYDIQLPKQDPYNKDLYIIKFVEEPNKNYYLINGKDFKFVEDLEFC